MGYPEFHTHIVSLWLDTDTKTNKQLYFIANSDKEIWEKVKELRALVYDICLGENSAIKWDNSNQTTIREGLVTDIINHALRGDINYRQIIETHQEQTELKHRHISLVCPPDCEVKLAQS
tara:strand:- start:48 stop:407 length:360 start_codon:yes stop_codon:yes gene_type:complete